MLSVETQSATSARREKGPRWQMPQFPDVMWQNGRGYCKQSKIDNYKAELQALALGVKPVYPPPPDPDPLVPLKAVAAQLGVGRRTIGRRIAESQESESPAAQ